MRHFIRTSISQCAVSSHFTSVSDIAITIISNVTIVTYFLAFFVCSVLRVQVILSLR